MAVSALAANSDRDAKGAGRIVEYPLSKEVEEFYKGAWLMIDSSGYVIVGADTASCQFIGVAVESKSITTADAADGTTKIRVYTAGDFLVGHETGDAAITSGGKCVCLKNDNSVDFEDSLTNDVKCGDIVRWKDADEVWVRIDNYAPLSVSSA